jgi:hypothetical protein
MGKYEEESEGASSSSKGPHPDYEVNLSMAQNFINRVEKSLRPGMNVTIKGSHGLDRSLLVISWTPPREAKVGNWANPIFLHQPKHLFAKSLENVFNDYVRKADNFERRLPYGKVECF